MLNFLLTFLLNFLLNVLIVKDPLEVPEIKGKWGYGPYRRKQSEVYSQQYKLGTHNPVCFLNSSRPILSMNEPSRFFVPEFW